MNLKAGVIEEYYETSGGLVAVVARIKINGDEMTFQDLWLYPTTSTKETIGVGPALSIFHALMDEARDLGFANVLWRRTAQEASGPGVCLE